MKKVIIFLTLLSLNFGVYAIQFKGPVQINQSTCIENYTPEVSTQNQANTYWSVFWVNFAISAIGVYSIYGFAAGIVSAGLTYFIYNGNKKAFKMAIWGAIAGAAVGLMIRQLVLFA
jgi:hypothetical protein